LAVSSGSGANVNAKEDAKGGENTTADAAAPAVKGDKELAPASTSVMSSNKSPSNDKAASSSSSPSSSNSKAPATKDSGGVGTVSRDANQQPKAPPNDEKHQEKVKVVEESSSSPSSQSEQQSEQQPNAAASSSNNNTKEAKAAAPTSNSNANQDDADDGTWETVEVKPRGRKAKSQVNNNNGSNNGSSNNNNNNGNNNGKGGNNTNNNGNRANNNSGRSNNDGNNNSNSNNNNNDVVTSSSNNNPSSSQNNNGQSNNNNNNSRRKKDGRRRKKNNNSNNNNQNQQQQQKTVENVIDGKGGGGGKPAADGGGAKSSSDNNNNNNHKQQHHHQQQRGRSSSHHNEKRAASTSGNHNNGNNKQQGRRSNSATTSVATNPPPVTSKHNGKSMRDVLLGTSSAAAAANNNKATTASAAGGKANDSTATTAETKSKNNADQQPKSAKVKPGISYKSAIEPVKKEQQQQQAAPSNSSKAKPNAWAKVVKSTSGVSLSAISNTSAAAGNETSNTATEVEEKEGTVKANDNVKTETKDASESSSPKASVPVVSTDTTKPSASEKNEKEIVGGGDEDVAATDDNNVPPPLDTLLGPGNSCSASSSVASSLDAPHGARPEDDVGYHLLNVCGQLSEEINTFMSRRSLALAVRRRERSAVLAALQDTLGEIWPDQCRVEMYGSCATQLDLPSSDLDLVVCGLDDVMNHPPPNMQGVNMSVSGSFNEVEIQQQESMGVTEEANSVSPDRRPKTATVAKTQQGQGDVTSPSASNSVTPVRNNSNSPGLFSGSNTSEHEPGMASVQDDSVHCSEDMEFHPIDNADSYSQGYPPGPHQQDMSMESYSSDYQGGSGENYPSSEYQGQQQDVGMENYNPEYQGSQHEFYYAPYNYAPHLSLNAQRVLRLASELELQPWAVQVKAIPTATVPVVKMLADPSRLPGFAGGSGANWMMQQQMSPQGAVSSSPPLSSEQMSHQGSVSSSTGFFPQWRGADLMNGLQPIDITFEGPEHGGIGSTTYSQCVVQDACNETGLPPESTPVVQVAMVLKELLAQRRLNEPFSGGLSSYGLLLLLLAVLKDRKIIQEDMKKMEKQREKVSGDDNRRNKGKKQLREPVEGQGKNAAPSSTSESIGQIKSQDAPSTTSKPTVSSSWASIAKKSNGSTTETYSMTLSTNESGANYSQTAQKQSKEKSKTPKDETLTEEAEAAEEADGSSSPKSQMIPQSSSVALDNAQAVLSQVTPSSDDSKLPTSSTPQSSNDVFEVLCSGELTSGKLLMHFLLFYGQHFDAQATLIDLNATHHPQFGKVGVERLSAFIPRPPGGNIDPITGMFSVDPLVVYDPLEGEIDYNVSKRCYCWNNVRWVFAQCYMTVSSIVETGDTAKTSLQLKHVEAKSDAKASSDKSCADIVTPILELLLSF
jgi:hypothetical protein